MTTSRIVYLNGNFLPITEAKISVMDRGFLFGDGIYEVIPVFNGKLFRPIEHLVRLKNSLSAIQLPNPLTEKNWLDLFDQLIQRNPEQGSERAIYLQITRGAPEKREHAFPSDNIEPTIFAQCTPIPLVDENTLMQGAKVVTAPDVRWANCYIKAITLLPNALMAELAKKSGVADVIMVRNGIITEGFASNIFVVKKGTILTPIADNTILHGITRDLVIDIARKNHIPFYEQNILVDSLKDADEIWMTGSLKEIQPITQVNDDVIGNGKVGPVWQKVFQYYQAYK